MRDKDSLIAEIEKDGRVVVEKHYVGKLEGSALRRSGGRWRSRKGRAQRSRQGARS